MLSRNTPHPTKYTTPIVIGSKIEDRSEATMAYGGRKRVSKLKSLGKKASPKKPAKLAKPG